MHPPLCQSLEVDSLAFQLLCHDLTTAMEHMHCLGRTRDDRAPHVFPLLSASAAVALAALLYAFWPRLGRQKARVNNNSLF